VIVGKGEEREILSIWGEEFNDGILVIASDKVEIGRRGWAIPPVNRS